MAKSAPNPKVDWYFIKNKQWQEEIETLRVYALESGLTEELKWGCPCYTLNGTNVFLIHCFKEYCAYLFMKGALMKDPKKILVQQTANVQSARQIRFTNAKEIVKLKTALKLYIKDAIEIEKSGKKVELKKTNEFNMPEEFKAKLDKNAALKKAFFSLTPGRQRGYLLYFSSAKQAATRESRIEKYTKHILNGKGIDD
ncbi:MAG: YdeI/OmpD-associated family protein [Bacteroidia bacterium]